MKITLEPTGIIERVQGVECRKWIGATGTGTPVHAWIAVVEPQTHVLEELEEFDRSFREVKMKRELVSFDYRMVL